MRFPKTATRTRRTVVRTAGAVLVAATGAGCLGAAGSDDSDPSTTTPDSPPTDGVTVAVGPVDGGETSFVFDPGTERPLAVDSGTTVRFVWESDTHNVVVEEQPDRADWQGHEQVEDAGFVHEHTFETTGTYRFVCEPHASVGMEGSITVE